MKITKKSLLGAFSAAGLLAASYMLVYAATAFDPDTAPVGYVGQTAVTSHIVSSGDERIFGIDYSALDWSGNLHSYALSETGTVGDVDAWDDGAAHQIDLQGWDAGRRIVTMNGGSKIPFRWGSLSTSQKTALDSATASIVSATSSPILNYIRGDRSNEKPNGLKYRARSTVLGDIIHSTPVYCKASDCGSATVFVGANDGMLHAIDANDGDERFAYVPSMLIPKLPALLADPYVHKYYVDGRMDLRKFGSQTILAGALGGGGKGLFALDVTDAAPADESTAASKILWEISAATSGFANLGYVYGQPSLRTLPDGTHALIVGNGYNNSGNGHAVLYVINAASGAKIAEIDTGSGSTGSPNGLSSPTLVDADLDGKVDYAFAGDIDGNLWKFKLSDNTVTPTPLFTTSPAQAITMAPGIKAHPNGGFMVTFVTGRLFNSSDMGDNATHYAYGIWDEAPVSNTTLLSQTLTEKAYDTVSPSIRVRTATNNTPDWTAGGHKGWKTALPIGGERMVGDGANVTGTAFVFMSTNPTINPSAVPPGENWMMQLNAMTGGDNGAIRFDLDASGKFDIGDQLSDGTIPVGRYMGGGVRSQLTPLSSSGMIVYQANFDRNTLPPIEEVEGDGPGISGGHFDYDIYYFGAPKTTTAYTPTTSSQTKVVCAKTSDVMAQLNKLATSFCKTPTFGAGYGYMTAFTTGTSCGGGKYNQSITCNTYTTSTTTTTGDYANKKHYHEYDDVFDVTGVNMLNASEPAFNLSPNVIASATATTPEFKVLVMNQFLNPAAKLSVGGAPEVSVKIYNDLASETNAATLLAGLPTYSRATVSTLLFNLPLDAFKSKDWWGTELPVAGVDIRSDGDGVLRAGLIPTQTGCVNKVNTDGSMVNSSGKGLLGPNGERFNGSLTIQIIKASTPASALEINHNNGDVRYGWRVKQSEFKNYVIAEYTAFWHHPNGKCYGQSGWVADAPEDNVSDATPKTPAANSGDPQDGIFAVGPTNPTNPDNPDNPTNPTNPNQNHDIVVSVRLDNSDPNNPNTLVKEGESTPDAALGRVNWREVWQ